MLPDTIVISNHLDMDMWIWISSDEYPKGVVHTFASMGGLIVGVA